METPKSVKQCGHLNRTVNQIWPQGIEVHFPAPITIYIYIYIYRYNIQTCLWVSLNLRIGPVIEFRPV